MDTPQPNVAVDKSRRRKGQTLAEFAITLPILLILVFGVIEFGRVFQAWVTLQNAARTAARYASTGQFNTTKYIVNENLEEDPDSIVPCTLSQDLRGTQGTYNAVGDTVNIYENGDESLFATWYDGKNCDPRNVDHQASRKDIARILSIIDEARRGAAGLAMGPDPLASVDSESEVRDFLYSQWDRPLPGGGQFNFHEGWDEPSYFDVMICSSRRITYDDPNTFYDGVGTRFYSLLDSTEAVPRLSTGGQDGKNAARAPVCVMNEIPSTDGGGLQNGGIPWLDAGGPGDAVTVVITFNHPLVTPLGLAPYIQLQARRAAVNEAFRQADATGALQGGAPLSQDVPIYPIARLRIRNNPAPELPGNVMTLLDGATTMPVLLDGSESVDADGPTGKPDWYIYTLNLEGGETLELARLHREDNGEYPDVNEPITGTDEIENKPPERFWFGVGTWEVTLTVIDEQGLDARMTITFTIKEPDAPPPPPEEPTLTDTPTDIPLFDCERLSASDVSFFNNRVWIQIRNENNKPTVMTRALFNWRRIGAFPNMYVAGMSLDGILHWRGQDFQPPTDTNADVPNPPQVFLEADRSVPGEDTVTWEAVFANGPAPIQDLVNNILWMTPHDLTGTTFTFDNPDSDQDCVIPLDLATPTPSPTVNPAVGTNTPTWTPDCAGEDVTIRFSNFDTFGVVRLLVTNNRLAPANFSDFRINWVANGQVLERVSAGGSSYADLTAGTLIWRAASGQDANPPTVGGTTAASANVVNNYATGSTGREGTWVTNYSFPPDSTTSLWIKFGVTNQPPDTAWGMQPSHLNGSWFQIGCGTPPSGDGGDGSWYGGDGTIHIFQEPTGVPTNTPLPSNTPKPTFTPSKTFTPGPPTNTPRPPTITNTPKPSNTPLPTVEDNDDDPGGPGNDGRPDG